MRIDRNPLCWLVVMLATLATACQKAPEVAAEPEVRRLENAELGLILADLPSDFEETSSGNGEWVFETAPAQEGDGTATLVLSLGEDQTGSINLVEAVKARRSWFESADHGIYYGNRELGGPFGAIYTARGAYDRDGETVEETWAYAIHPGEYRRLQVQFAYPAGQSATRVEQLLSFLGEIEAAPIDDAELAAE